MVAEATIAPKAPAAEARDVGRQGDAQAMREEIVPADRRTRTVMLALLVAAVVLFALASRIGELISNYNPTADPEQALRELVERTRLFATLGAIPLLAFVVYFATRGLRTLQCGAWPPYGMKVPWSVVRRRGRYAVAMGIGCLAMATILVVQVGMSLWFAWHGAQ